MQALNLDHIDAVDQAARIDGRHLQDAAPGREWAGPNSSSAFLSPATLFQLQRAAGNAAVSVLLERQGPRLYAGPDWANSSMEKKAVRASRVMLPSPVAAPPPRMLQRSCGCGGSCASCSATNEEPAADDPASEPPLQRLTLVGAPSMDAATAQREPDDPDAGAGGAAAPAPDAASGQDPAAAAAAGAVLSTISSADPTAVAQDPDTLAQWLAGPMSSLASIAGSADGGGGGGGGGTEEPTAQTMRAGDHPRNETLVAGRDGSLPGGTVIQRDTDPDAPVHNTPGCCDAEYAAWTAAYDAAKKDEIDATNAAKKVIAVASGGAAAGGAAAGGVVGGLAKSIAKNPLAGIAIAIATYSALMDAKAANDKWGITIKAMETAKQNYWSCFAPKPANVCPATGILPLSPRAEEREGPQLNSRNWLAGHRQAP